MKRSELNGSQRLLFIQRSMRLKRDLEKSAEIYGSFIKEKIVDMLKKWDEYCSNLLHHSFDIDGIANQIVEFQQVPQII